MAGRNLFAGNKPVGRNLFADDVQPEPEQQAAPDQPQEKSTSMQFRDALAETIGLPVDLIGAALEKMGINVGDPIGGGESLKKGLDAMQTPSEVVTTLATGAIAEPVAGVAGMIQAANPLSDEGAGAETVDKVRESITFKPQDARAQEILSGVAETIEPVTTAFKESEDALGNFAMEKTGSPAIAAAAKTIPTAITELLGYGLGKGALNTAKSAKEIKLIKEVGEAAPSAEQLKTVSRNIFKEIDELGASVKKSDFQSVVNEISQSVRKKGLDSDVTPKSAKTIKRLEEATLNGDVSLSEIETLRAVAKNAAGDINNAPDAAIGAQIVDAIDEFIDKADPSTFSGNQLGIGNRYKVARDLWGRAKRSEMLQEAFTNARNQASGFENGIRTQFRSILRSQKKRRFFRDDELKALEKVVQGGRTENLAKLLGRFSFSEGGAMNTLMGSAGVAGGAAVGGPVGAVVVPIIGQVSRNLAQKLTRNNAKMADQVIRAGKDARKITTAYIKNTSKAKRSAEELSELLMQPYIDLDDLPNNVISIEAAKIARERRAAGAAAVATGATASGSTQN